MTKTKKLTAEAFAEAARKGGAKAVSALIDEIVKDAPRIPGLVELEEKYGVGNIPMLAVHESTRLSLKDKKLLFQIAGYEYDGTMPEKKLPTKDARAAEAEADEQYQTFYTETAESYENLMYHDAIGALAGQAFGGTEKQFANRKAIRAWGLAELPDFKLSAKSLKEVMELAAELRSRLSMAAQRG
jgi:hypothetical protein